MSTAYFPNKPIAILEGVKKIRRISEDLSPQARLDLFSQVSALVPDLVSATIEEEDDVIRVAQQGRYIYFPAPLPNIKLDHIVCGYIEWIWRKYSLPGFVEAEAGDCVIDCGAFVGGFAMGAAAVGAKVHAFEPEVANFECLSRNMQNAAHATCVQSGLYSFSGAMKLNMSHSAVEHSLLLPDDGDVVDQVEIDVVSLADYAARAGLKQIDFLKLEAEGVEPEIYEGLGDLRPRKIAIDVSPERDGESPAEFFEDILSRQGYETRRRVNVLFARLPTE